MKQQIRKGLQRSLTCLALVYATCCTLSSWAAIDTNIWQKTSGNWSDDANWSLGHAPKDYEYVIIPNNGNISITLDSMNCVCGCFYVDYNTKSTTTLTVSGDGALTVSGSCGSAGSENRQNEQSCFRYSRKFVLDGATFAINGANSALFYSPVEIVNGATFSAKNGANLWWNSSSLLIDNATVQIGSDLIYRYGRTLQVTNGGTLTLGNSVTNYNAASSAIAITVTNGSRIDSPNGKLWLMGGSSVTLADTSTLRFSTFPTTVGDTPVTYALKGGTYTVAGTCTTEDLAFMEKSQGTKFVFENAINTSSTAGEVLDWKGDLSVPTMRLYGVPTLRLEDDATLSIGQFLNYGTNNNDTDAWMPRIDCRNIVFTAEKYPFTSIGDQRFAHVIGPVTMRAKVNVPRNSGKNSYTLVTGDVVIDTADPDDATVTHTIDLKTFGPRDYATLTIRGGGKVILGVAQQANRFQRVTVEEGTTLEIITPDGGTDWGTLNTEAFTMKAGATLRLSVKSGGNDDKGRGSRVTAHKWSLDPTASVVVTDVSTLASGARALLDGDSTDSLPANAASLVTIEGEAEGWSVLQGNGAVYVSKSTGEIDGTYTYEWTGNGTTRNFSEDANWYKNARAIESQPMFFGAADTYTSLNIDHVWNASDTTKNGSTVGSLNFRETAVKAFTITGNQTTFSKIGTSVAAPSDWSVSTESFVPQKVELEMRNVSNRFSLFASHGSLTIGKGTSTFVRKSTAADYGYVAVAGDVRVFAETPESIQNQAAMIQFLVNDAIRNTGVGTRYTVVGNGKTQRFYGQTSELGACVGTASLAVNEGAKLVFNDKTTGQTAAFDWGTVKPAISRIDGTLELNVPFVAQANQFYAGAGTIAFNKTAALKGDGKVATVGLTDALKVNLPAGAWTTATAATPAGALSLTAEGAPTLLTGGDWRYGVSAGVTATSAAADRALKLEAGATLTIDAGGGTATIAENVTGRGTIVITNGTLALTGDFVEQRIAVEVAPGATLTWTGEKTFASVKAAAGSTVRPSAGAILSAAKDIDLADDSYVTPELAYGEWTRLATYGGSVKGLVYPSDCRTREIELENGLKAFEVKARKGLLMIVR